ncbi:uncharacterized protein EI90DRAFT_3136620 [Cantharellus anzutake]|uniref:uncharacterized protein n=1 Tax=Cantharellus anzutake TaxID=1750568 RepID=UPI001907811D|nr:uncharacterized protein EI90DRAFT_3136620 [Cantharellus anzutake]KAF8313525.1 hypothetical protein EI90DRAFT_3136620 [Cantharellus anzutake]
MSGRSISSISSNPSTLWSGVVSSSLRLSTSVADICSHIKSIPDAHLHPIKEIVVREEEDGVRHEFLLLRLAQPTEEELWMRLERKGPTSIRAFMSTKWEANDTATFSGERDSLLEGAKSVEKTRIIFYAPPSLKDLLCVLETLTDESKSYRLLSENCYFFASVVAENLCGLAKSAECTEPLRWLDLGSEVRQKIRQKIASCKTHSVHHFDADLGSGVAGQGADQFMLPPPPYLPQRPPLPPRGPPPPLPPRGHRRTTATTAPGPAAFPHARTAT